MFEVTKEKNLAKGQFCSAMNCRPHAVDKLEFHTAVDINLTPEIPLVTLCCNLHRPEPSFHPFTSCETRN